MPTVDFSTVRDVALAIVVGAVVLAVVFAIAIKWIIGKLVVVGILAAIAGLVWWQRDAAQECAHQIRATLPPGGEDSTACTFFGREITVQSPLG